MRYIPPPTDFPPCYTNDHEELLWLRERHEQDTEMLDALFAYTGILDV